MPQVFPFSFCVFVSCWLAFLESLRIAEKGGVARRHGV